MAYKKGESGNLKGRPIGKTVGGKLRKAIEAKSDAILKVITDAALGGDLQACQILLNKVIAPLKAVAPNVELPNANNAGLAQQGTTVIQAALSGTISPDVAAQLLSALASQAKIIETTELIERIEALEIKNANH